VAVACFCATAGAALYSSGTLTEGFAIPQSNGQYLLSDSYVFSGIPGDITDLAVHLDIAGGHTGGLYGYLLLEDSSDNPVVLAVLLNRAGRDASHNNGYSDSGLDVVFVPYGADIHQYQTVPYHLNSNGQLTGTWGADGRNDWPGYAMSSDARTALLNSFLGADPNGRWTLALFDANNSSASSTLVSWSLEITAVPEPTTMIAGALLLLPFWASTLRILRESRAASEAGSHNLTANQAGYVNLQPPRS